MDKHIALLKHFFAGLIGMNADSISMGTWHAALQARKEQLNLATPEQYWEKIQQSKPEQAEFLEYLVVPETWLFRHKDSYQFLKHLVHEEWVKQDRRTDPLRILSVPCSTGEEPYSLAITLLEAGVPPGWFSVDAVDLSQKAINEAVQGIIAERSFRGCDDHYKRVYFTPLGKGRYEVQHFVRRQVRFMQGNIVSGSFLIERRPYDIIFCRNLFIYLTHAAQEKAKINLDRLLTDQGLLFVSPVESQIVRGWGYISEGNLEACAFLKHKKVIKNTAAPVVAAKGHQENLPSLLHQIHTEADAGHFEVAANLCEKYLQADNTNSEAQFMLGIIEQARGNEYNAEKAFTKAIYLNPKHIDALVCLSLLLEKKGDAKQAQLLRERVQREKV